METGQQGGKTEIAVRILNADAVPLEFEARLLSGFHDQGDPRMELTHDLARARVVILPET